MEKILKEIEKERQRQLYLWGNKADNLNTRNDWASYICNYVANGAYNGKDNEFSEEHFRANLIKAATICVAAIEAIDRLSNLPKTEIELFLHKDDTPNA